MLFELTQSYVQADLTWKHPTCEDEITGFHLYYILSPKDSSTVVFETIIRFGLDDTLAFRDILNDMYPDGFVTPESQVPKRFRTTRIIPVEFPQDSDCYGCYEIHPQYYSYNQKKMLPGVGCDYHFSDPDGNQSNDRHFILDTNMVKFVIEFLNRNYPYTEYP